MTYRQLVASTEHRVVDVRIIDKHDPASFAVVDSIVGTTIRIVEPTIELDLSRYEILQRVRSISSRELPMMPWRVSGDDFHHADIRQHFSCFLIESITVPE